MKKFRVGGHTLREKLFKRTVLFWYLHCFVNKIWHKYHILPLTILNNLFGAIWLSDKYSEILPKFYRFMNITRFKHDR